jgi:hypothetical protein
MSMKAVIIRIHSLLRLLVDNAIVIFLSIRHSIVVLPSAAGATARPTTPASATIVSA